MRLYHEKILRKINEARTGRNKRRSIKTWMHQISKIDEKRGKKMRNIKKLMKLTEKSGRNDKKILLNCIRILEKKKKILNLLWFKAKFLTSYYNSKTFANSIKFGSKTQVI